MLKSLFTAATGMRAQQTRIDVIANNLANVNTSGFKKSLVNFEDLLYTTIQGASQGENQSRPTPLQIGAGSRLVSTSKVFSQGVIERTDRALDLVISGEGFFKLSDINGNAVYSRDGNFNVDAIGQIVSGQGLKIEPAVTVPDGATVNVEADGRILAKVGDGPTQEIGRIALVNFANPAGLESAGGNVMRETDASGAPIEGTPGSLGLGSIQSGALERSNVDVVSELVNLIISQRAYETNSRAISAADEMLTTVNQIVR